MNTRRRTLIPEMWRDLDAWKRPAKDGWSKKRIDQYDRREEAVYFYEQQWSYEEIEEVTGIEASEVRRFVHRCLTDDGAGGIVGFRALAPNEPVASYTRRALVTGIRRSARGGYSGALGALLESHDGLLEFIEGRLFPKGRSATHPKVAFRKLVHEIHELLRSYGLSDDEWPFCTDHGGYQSFCNLFHMLGDKNAAKWAKARGGRNAYLRLNVGTGHKSLVLARRAGVFMQMDFAEIDAACVIVIEWEDGTETLVNVERFHIGLVVEERTHCIVGAFLSLEAQPTIECTIATLTSALHPSPTAASDPWTFFIQGRQILPLSRVPELVGQGCAVLRLDNGANFATLKVIEQVVDVLGCAIDFGPVGAWWTRAIVENTIGRLSALGAKTRSSTYGTGPADPYVEDPVGEAKRNRILLSTIMAIVADAIVELNNRSSSGALRGHSAEEVLQRAVATPSSGYLPQPLPHPGRGAHPMNWMPVELTVEGSKTEGKRVYFRYLERTYTSDSFSGRYDLVGERAQGYVNIFDIREMEASILSTGEDLGRLFTRASWDQEPVSMRTAKLTARDCRLKNAQSTWQWQQDRAEKADGERKTKSGKDRNSRAAREVAKTMTTLDVQFERDGGIASQAPVPNREPAFWKSDRAPSKSVKRGAR